MTKEKQSKGKETFKLIKKEEENLTAKGNNKAT